MSYPLLSILIPSIPSRIDDAKKIIDRLTAFFPEDVEILMLLDNKKMSIGMKRELLKNMSKGKYFMFVDDDDNIINLDVFWREFQKGAERDVDVITFKQQCRNSDGSSFIVTFGLGNEVEHNTENGRYLDCKRPPFHVCAWNARFRNIAFGDVNYAEDWVFVEKANKLATTEYFIDEVVHSYNFDPNKTEASTESNIYWNNPNEQKNKPMRRAIITLGNNEKYQRGTSRLSESIANINVPDVDFFRIQSEAQVFAPPHSDNPYAFKLYCIQYLRKLGYTQILWLDASIVAVKDYTPVFDWLTDKGIFLEEAGHLVGTWCNDSTLRYFNITRDEAMKMPMFAAGYCGFDFNNPKSIEFFAAWNESMLNGCFKGSWSDHRHDMTCGSIIANKMGLVKDYSPGGQFFAYIGPAYQPPKPTAVFHLIGL
jgi:hypothetical protein